MKLALIFLLTILSISPQPTTLPQAEKDELIFVESMKQRGFSDRILDRLHKSIAMNIGRMRSLIDKNYLKNAYRYLALDPANQIEINRDILFFTDKENKPYFKINISQGLSIEEYPDKYLFDTKAFIYFAEDGKSLTKIILQFTRMNYNGDRYVKEVRRITNPTPASPEPMKLEGEKIDEVKKLQEENILDDTVVADKNDDIYIEYFSMHDKDIKWVTETPEIDNPVAMKNSLNDPKELLSYQSQKKIFDTYRILLKVVDREVTKKVKNIELTQRVLLQKMSEINY
jgi:hypothetical protein